MFTLDLRTVMFSYILTNLVCLLAMGALWLQSARSPALRYWVADSILQFLAIVLITLRGSIPDVVSIVVSNGCVVGGTLLLYIGLELYVGRVSRQLHNYILLGVFISVHWFFTVVQPSLWARNLNFTVALLILCAQSAWLLLGRAGLEVRPVTRWVGFVFLAYCGVSIFRLIVDLGRHPGNDFWASSPYDTLVILTYQILFMGLAFALLLMHNSHLLAALRMDLEEQRRVASNLRTFGSVDPLTGLHNRGYFEHEAARLSTARQFPFSVLVLDVDGLKEINDRDGHPAGDLLLQQMAQVLKAGLRSGDVVARIGGDEFAVIMPNTDATSARAIVRRLEGMLQKHNAADPTAPLRASFGVSTSRSDDSFRTVLERADREMYHGRRTRRGSSG